jgi:CBS domain-containing protein
MLTKETKTARDLLGPRLDVVSVAPDTTVLTALRIMADRNIGAVVVAENGVLKGILSERDYARKVEIRGLAAKDVLVRQIMTESVVTADPETTIDDCMRIMHVNKIRHLPVVHAGKAIGMLSARDVLEEEIREEHQHAEELERERLFSTTDTGTY